MRIFCAVRHSIDPRQFYGELWSANFYPALRELGHEVIESQVDLTPTSRFMQIASEFTPEELDARARTSEAIIHEVEEALRHGPIDLFLSYFYNSHFDPACFDDLRKLGIPSVNFYCNSIYQFELVAQIAAKADYSWHTERDARNSYLGVGAKPIWVQLGADPTIYRPVSDLIPQPKACFIGQKYADRDRWLHGLIAASVPVDIFGSGWKTETNEALESASLNSVYLGRQQSQPGKFSGYLDAARKEIKKHGVFAASTRLWKQAVYRRESVRLAPALQSRAKGRLPADQLAATMSSYGVVLNFSNVWADGRPGSALIPHVRLRDFEAPMCRACYLTGHTDEIEEFYQVSAEIDTYRTIDELIEKVQFYLRNQSAAEKMRAAGHRRALRDHTWKRRFEQLFAKIGVK